jgi:hypothetical protein
MKNHRLVSPFRRQSRRLILLAGLVGGLGVGALTTASAQAATTSKALGLLAAPLPAAVSGSSAGCATTATVSQPFAQWGDGNYYDLVPGGDFEGSLAGWTLTGGAGTVAGSEPYGATGVVGARSLYLPAGASAQSPYFCVDPSDPTFRFFAKNDGLISNISVAVVYQGPLGPIALPVGVVALSGSWEPSAQMLTNSALASALNGAGTAEVALRFTAVGGPSQIDDVFVDPRCK